MASAMPAAAAASELRSIHRYSIFDDRIAKLHYMLFNGCQTMTNPIRNVVAIRRSLINFDFQPFNVKLSYFLL